MNGAFEDCDCLTKITIPSTLATIPHKTFKGCTALASVIWPDSTPIPYATNWRIDDDAFQDCTSLTSIDIPEGCIRLGSFVFQGE
jgi:hypothetical protein